MDLEKETISQAAVDEVLLMDEDPIAKVQDLIGLGFDEEVANDIVERYQIGQQTAVYYEQLPVSQKSRDL